MVRQLEHNLDGVFVGQQYGAMSGANNLIISGVDVIYCSADIEEQITAQRLRLGTDALRCTAGAQTRHTAHAADTTADTP